MPSVADTAIIPVEHPATPPPRPSATLSVTSRFMIFAVLCWSTKMPPPPQSSVVEVLFPAMQPERISSVPASTRMPPPSSFSALLFVTYPPSIVMDDRWNIWMPPPPQGVSLPAMTPPVNVHSLSLKTTMPPPE